MNFRIKAGHQVEGVDGYCPVPGLVPTSPANRDYQPRFTTAMMLKDLKLAQHAAQAAKVATSLGARAAALYALHAKQGNGAEDFSGIVRFLRGT